MDTTEAEEEEDFFDPELELPENDDSTNNNVHTPSSSFSSIASYPSTPSSLCSSPGRHIGGGEIEEIPSWRFLSSSFREVFRPRFRSRSRSSMASRNDYCDEAHPSLTRFSLRELQVATNNFNSKNFIGSGKFAQVYKGRLVDGSLVAVKRLKKNGTPERDLGFLAEVDIGSLVAHSNILPLRGFCGTSKEKLLVFPYMANGGVDTWLRDPTKKGQLYWERRYKIIGGIARGLMYLHEESQVKIIHRDLKARNIMLDSDMNPIIENFWIARLFYGDQTQASSNRIVGTFGYMAPEYAMRGQFSIKADVFSFGVLVLEIVTGRKNRGIFSSKISAPLLSYVWQHWRRGTISGVVDPSFGGNCPLSEALRCIQIGLLCVQESPADRPTMSEVVRMLDGDDFLLAERWEQCRIILEEVHRGTLPTVHDEYQESIELSSPR